MSGAGGGTSARIERLALAEFRCLREVELELDPGLTVLTGRNGQGKTSLLEAVGWIARSRSFRGGPDSVLVRHGADRAIVRAEILEGDGRRLFEAEIRPTGRNRVLLNHKPVVRARDLHGLLRVTVFSPDDLVLAKGGPAERRAYLDDLLASLSARYDAARTDYERVLKQRNALLRASLRNDDDRVTLEVFDEQLVAAGSELVRGRLRLARRLAPQVDAAYRELAGSDTVTASYRAEWAEGVLDESAAEQVAELLSAALGARRRAELDRGMTLVGPHRDEWQLLVGEFDARTEASQGEQRTLALALRLAGHRTVEEIAGVAPVLLLDDVFSELDADRSEALVGCLPESQTLLTAASALPAALEVHHRFLVVDGRVEPATGRRS